MSVVRTNFRFPYLSVIPFEGIMDTFVILLLSKLLDYYLIPIFLQSFLFHFEKWLTRIIPVQKPRENVEMRRSETESQCAAIVIQIDLKLPIERTYGSALPSSQANIQARNNLTSGLLSRSHITNGWRAFRSEKTRYRTDSMVAKITPTTKRVKIVHSNMSATWINRTVAWKCS